MNKLLLDEINSHQQMLNEHRLLTGGVEFSIEDVRTFMEFHVFAVWDFMCLAKSLQKSICPAENIWVPSPLQRSCGRLINEIILGEETDESPWGDHMSHFDLYVRAMDELHADTSRINAFIHRLQTSQVMSVNQMLLDIPYVSQKFVNTTLNFVMSDQPHVIAAAFTFGRETVIPDMFTNLQDQLSDIEAPAFKYYLQRHIDLDGDAHGPAALKLIDALCEGDPTKEREVHSAALQAIESRKRFWDDVVLAIETIRQIKK